MLFSVLRKTVEFKMIENITKYFKNFKEMKEKNKTYL